MKTLMGIMLIMVFSTSTTFGATGVMEWPKEAILAESVEGDRIIIEFFSGRNIISVQHCLGGPEKRDCVTVGPHKLYKTIAVRPQRNLENRKLRLGKIFVIIATGATGVGAMEVAIGSVIAAPFVITATATGFLTLGLVAGYLTSNTILDIMDSNLDNSYNARATLDDLIELSTSHSAYWPEEKLSSTDFMKYLEHLDEALGGSNFDDAPYSPYLTP